MYGLWLLSEPPKYYESLIAATLAMALFAVCYILFVPRLMAFFVENEPVSVPNEMMLRTKRRCGAREILVLLTAVCIFRVLMVFLSYHFYNLHYGYTCTIFSAQRMWAAWSDAPHYMFIAEHGYVTEAASANSEFLTLVFLPFYSYVTSFFALISENYVRAGYFVSHISTVLGCAMLYLLVKIDFDRKTARRAVKYFCILPAACLLYATMSDGLFFLLSVTALYCARKKYIPLAALFAAFAAYTRIIGVVLLVPLVMEYVRLLLTERRLKREHRWKFVVKQTFTGLSLLLIPLAIGTYLLQNYLVSGNAFQILIYQRENWSQGFSYFFRTVGYQTDNLIRSVLASDTETSLGLCLPNLLYIFSSLAVLLLTVKKMRASYVAYYFAYFFVAVSVSWLLSAPRYLTCCFPLILGLAMLTKKKYVDIPLTIICLAGFVLYLYGFVNGYPIY